MPQGRDDPHDDAAAVGEAVAGHAGVPKGIGSTAGARAGALSCMTNECPLEDRQGPTGRVGHCAVLSTDGTTEAREVHIC
jgi:hypothetical protein